jgi:signal peptidase II
MARDEAVLRRPDGPLSVLGLSVVAATVAIDQVAKYAAEASLPIGQPVELLPILDLYRIHNTGIAFSMLSRFGGVPLTLLTVAITIIVLAFWWRTRDGGRLAAVGFALIVGCAVGNLIDRLRFGHVVDFLLLHIGDWTLFVFNLADAGLTLGPILLLVAYVWPTRA